MEEMTYDKVFEIFSELDARVAIGEFDDAHGLVTAKKFVALIAMLVEAGVFKKESNNDKT